MTSKRSLLILFGLVSNLSRKKLYCSYKDEGLRLPNIKLYDLCLKSSWISKLSFRPQWYETHLRNPYKPVMWQGNLNIKDMTKFSKSVTKFCKNVFQEGNIVTFTDKIFDSRMTMEQSLWYNSHIRIGNNVAYDMKLYTSGITQVWDIMVGDRLL